MGRRRGYSLTGDTTTFNLLHLSLVRLVIHLCGIGHEVRGFSTQTFHSRERYADKKLQIC